MKRSLFAAILLLAGCVPVHSVSRDATLILKAKVEAGTFAHAEVPVYSKALVHHLKIKLYDLSSGDQATGVERTLLNAQLDNPVVIGSLKPQNNYRVRAYAYASSDDSLLISTADSFADILVESDDRPSLGNLNVRLIDRPFAAQASSTLLINPGAYSPLGSESLTIPGFEGVVTTLAGSGSAGIADGTGTLAMFNQPTGIVLDSAGNFFVVDRENHRICKVTKQGVVTTFAGNGTAHSLDATGTAARFNSPVCIAIDQSDNLYVTEVYGHKIRKITKTAVVTTLAGSGVDGSQDGTGTEALLSRPHGIAVSPSGEVYFTEAWSTITSNRIRKIATNGVVTTVAGAATIGCVDGIGTAARFSDPFGLIFDSQGNLYISDCNNHSLRKMTPDRMVTTIVGNSYPGSRDGYGTLAQLDRPGTMAFDNEGNLYITTGWIAPDYRIKKITPSGMVTTLAGLGVGNQDGTGYNAKFNRAEAIVFDPAGALYVTDRYNHLIRKIQ